MPEYLIRCVQQHESFRKAELEALATLTGVGMEFISYSESVCSLSLLYRRASQALKLSKLPHLRH